MGDLRSRPPENDDISGNLGIYVQYMTPKVRALVYKYLIFVATRAARAEKRVTVITNDPTVQSFVKRLGLDEDIVWRVCDQLYLFTITEEAMDSEEISLVLDAISDECKYDEIKCDYVAPDSARKIDLRDVKFVRDKDEYKKGKPYFIDNPIKDLPIPYPLMDRHPQALPPFSPYQQNVR